jgi:hypothetical protein
MSYGPVKGVVVWDVTPRTAQDVYWSVEVPASSFRGTARGSLMVEALCHKPEGRGFETQ